MPRLLVRPFTIKRAALAWNTSEAKAEKMLDRLCEKALLLDSDYKGVSTCGSRRLNSAVMSPFIFWIERVGHIVEEVGYVGIGMCYCRIRRCMRGMHVRPMCRWTCWHFPMSTILCSLGRMFRNHRHLSASTALKKAGSHDESYDERKIDFRKNVAYNLYKFIINVW